MSNYQKRDSEILQMSKEGRSYNEIARNFDISHKRVWQIVRSFEIESERKQRSEKIQRMFRASNDLDKKWPTEIIIDGLLFPKKFKWRLLRYFKSQNIREMSLRDLMNFLIADFEAFPDHPFDAMPVYRQKDFGVKTFHGLILHLSEQDLGPSFNTEWTRRLKKLAGYLTRIGWSVPSFLHKHLRMP